MAKSNRQKYNFLVAWTKQLTEACEDGEEVGADAVGAIGTVVETLGVHERVDRLEQWIAKVETRMDELEQSIGEDSDEDIGLDDDGDPDLDLGRDEPEVERESRRLTRDTRSVAAASDRQVVGRRVADGQDKIAPGVRRSSRR